MKRSSGKTGKPDIRIASGIQKKTTDANAPVKDVLRRAFRDWEGIFQSIGHPAFILDPQQYIIAANRAAERQLKKSREDLIGKKCHEIMHGESKNPPECCPLVKLLSSRKFETFEMEVEALGGTFLVSCTPMFDDSGNLEKIIHIAMDVTERKRAEEEVFLANERINYLLAATSAVIYAAQPSGDYPATFLSGNVARMTGYEAREFIEDSHFWWDHVHPDDRERALKEVLKIFEKELHSYEYRFQRKDGTYLWMRDEMKLIRDDKGRPLEIIGFWLDITERRQAMEALQQSEESHRMVVETTGQLIYDYDVPSGRILWAGAIEAMTGYQPDEFAHVDIKIWEEMIHPEDRTVAISQLDDALKAASPYHVMYRFRCKDGTYVDIEDTGAFLKDDRGKAYRMLGAMKEITERKQSESKLRESEEKYRSFFENDLTGDYITTIDGRILACNPSFARIFGFNTVEEALHARAEDLYKSPEQRKDFLQTLRERKKLEYYEMEMRRLNGQPVYIVENTIGKFDEHGDLIGIQGYIFDDTKRKKLEDHVIQVQKMDSIGTMAGGIAHDFNNILGIIGGYSSMLDMVRENREKFLQYVNHINKATVRGAALVKQILTFARKTEVSLTPVSVNGAIKELVKMLEETFPKTITITTSLEKSLPLIMIDRTSLNQALLNLCVNSRDAMPNGGSLSLSTKLVDGNKLAERFSKAGANMYIAVSVADTGIGMDESTRAKIFEPFFTTKEIGRGTGLGLSVVYGIVEAHRGFVGVESAPGSGTAITLYFPIPGGIMSSEEAVAVDIKDIAGGKETILIVEDEEALLEILSTLLESKGYTVLKARNGLECVEVYEHRKEGIDLILSDTGLPGMSGADAFLKIASIDPGVKMILASGFFDPDQKAELRKAGVTRFIQKPYKHQDILKEVRSVLDER